MNLTQKRTQWEAGGDEILVVTDKKVFSDATFYPTVYVVLKFDGGYSLHRYFSLMDIDGNEDWEVSVDVANSTLEECLEKVTNDFQESYPTDD